MSCQAYLPCSGSRSLLLLSGKEGKSCLIISSFSFGNNKYIQKYSISLPWHGMTPVLSCPSAVHRRQVWTAEWGQLKRGKMSRPFSWNEVNRPRQHQHHQQERNIMWEGCCTRSSFVRDQWRKIKVQQKKWIGNVNIYSLHMHGSKVVM